MGVALQARVSDYDPVLAFDPGVGLEASCILGDSNLNSGLQAFPA
jgi:hypothetical protein